MIVTCLIRAHCNQKAHKKISYQTHVTNISIIGRHLRSPLLASQPFPPPNWPSAKSPVTLLTQQNYITSPPPTLSSSFSFSFSSSYLPCDRLGRSLISETRRTPPSLHTEGRASAKGLRAFWVAQFLIYSIDLSFLSCLILLILTILFFSSPLGSGLCRGFEGRLNKWGFGLLKEGSAL